MALKLPKRLDGELGPPDGGVLMGSGPESNVVSLTDLLPPARYDGLPWTAATIGEAAASTGPFNQIDSFTFSSPDANPAEPAPRSLTTTKAQLAAGWYQVVFSDAGGATSTLPAIAYPPADDQPSVPYCSVLDVQARTANRPVTASSVPNIGQVQQFIVDAAAEINAILIHKGYLIPIVSASNPDAFATLHSLNVTGAWAMMEASAPTSQNLDRAEKAWEAARKMLGSAEFVLNAPMDMARSEARGPWVTSQPDGRTFDPLFGRRQGGHRGNPRDPYFTREMHF